MTLADLSEKEIFKPKLEGREPAIHAENQEMWSSHRKCKSSQVTEKLTCSNGVKRIPEDDGGQCEIKWKGRHWGFVGLGKEISFHSQCYLLE